MMHPAAVFFLLLCYQASQATELVRLSVSKVPPTAASNTSSNTTASTISTSTDNNINLSSESTTELVQQAEESATTHSTARTTFPNFVVPTLPTKKTKTYIRTMPSTTSTTASVDVTTPATTTTTQATATSNTTTETPHTIRETAGRHQHYCACDLRSVECDINCCCDGDCTPAMLQVFDCHAPAAYPELRKQYEHGLPSCKVNEGWLCVFRTNIALNQPQQRLHTHFDTALYAKWPDMLTELASAQEAHSITAERQNFYRYNNALLLLNMKTLELENFELPVAYHSAHCVSKQPVRHLKAQQRNCLLTGLDELRQQRQTLLDLAASSKVLLAPQRLASPTELMDTQSADFQLSGCSTQPQGAVTCQPLQLENGTYSDKMAAADHYTNKIVLRLTHNYTHILGAAIELHEQPLNVTADTEFWLTYDIQFNSKPNNATNHSMVASGPLGYLQGEPVIAARLVASNSSEALTAANQVLDYFQPTNATKSSLQLFTQRASFCHKSNAKEYAINFGINTHKSCTLRLERDVAPIAEQSADYNYTSVCLAVQTAAWAQLFGANLTLEQLLATPLYISQLGRPQNSTDKWLPLELPHAADAVSPLTVAEYHAASGTFVCRNILLSLTYEFQIGIFTLEETERQALITHAALVLGTRLDLEFSADGALELPLSVAVMFYDHTHLPSSTAAALNRWETLGIYVFLVLILCLNLRLISV